MEVSRFSKATFATFSAFLIGILVIPNFAFGANETEKSRLESYNKLRNAIEKIETYYVDEISFDELIDKAIDGMISNLDAHSAYLNEKKHEELKIQTDGEFGGIGITISMRDGALTIISPIEGTPGDKAGLKSGDIILKINDQSTLSMTIDDAINLMRGKPKTKVQLTIVRKNALKPLVFDIVRDSIKVESVYAKRIHDSNYAYVRVTSFDKKVTQRVQEELGKVKDLKGIILDLRNNPGGLLNQAVELSNLFISDGVIVSQKGRVAQEDMVFRATKKAPFANIPLVVLVNNGSASASEIVAGALQDTKRAVLVGETTFGKGSVQVILPMEKNEAMRLTVARWYLPSGRTMQAVGITPDVLVYPGKVPNESSEFTVKEADLKQHLVSELEKISPSEAKKETNTKDSKVITEEDINNDIQLKSAIDALKTLLVVKK